MIPDADIISKCNYEMTNVATGEDKVSVTDDGKLIEMINELEMIGGASWRSQRWLLS